MQLTISMVLALAMILFGAELFTNAVEWLGQKLHLGQGAVGSVLAALGTALPETAVPVTAIVVGGGSHAAQEVGIGGILGAPFLLVTLGSLIMALSLLLTRRSGDGQVKKLKIEAKGFHRDMSFFLIAYAFVVSVGAIPVPQVHRVAPFVLVAIYVLFLILTFRDNRDGDGADELHPLYIQWKETIPSMKAVIFQLMIALVGIVGGAQLLSTGVEKIALWLNIPPFVLSALLIPLATELPETLNSVVWIRKGKDALAMGNITGAMVFQSTLVPALGILLTPWNLTTQALLTGGLTLAAGTLIYGFFKLKGRIVPSILTAASLLYFVLPLQVAVTPENENEVMATSGIVILLLLILFIGRGLKVRSV